MSPTTMVRVVFSLYTIWSTHTPLPSPTAGGIHVIDMFALHTTNHSPIKWMTVLQLGLPCSSSSSSARGGSKEGHVGVEEVYERGWKRSYQAKRPKTFQFSWKFGQRFVERQINLRGFALAQDRAQHTLFSTLYIRYSGTWLTWHAAVVLGLSKFRVILRKRNQYRNCNCNRNSYLNKAETGNGNVHCTCHGIGRRGGRWGGCS